MKVLKLVWAAILGLSAIFDMFLALSYHHGWGVPKDTTEAVYWLVFSGIMMACSREVGRDA